jgi:hypothetical protein
MSQEGEEDDTVGDRRTDDDTGLLADLRAALEAADGVPEALVAAARLTPDIVTLDEDYLRLVESEALTGATRPREGRTIAFGSSGCRLDLTIDEVGGPGVVVDGRVTGLPVEEIVHESTGGSRAASVDELGYFTMDRVPRGLGRLVVRAADGRRLPAAWIVF